MHNLPYYICGLLIVILFYWVLLKNDQFEGVSVKENYTDIFLVMRHFMMIQNRCPVFIVVINQA